jgi:hypothetical protein
MPRGGGREGTGGVGEGTMGRGRVWREERQGEGRGFSVVQTPLRQNTAYGPAKKPVWGTIMSWFANLGLETEILILAFWLTETLSMVFCNGNGDCT